MLTVKLIRTYQDKLTIGVFIVFDDNMPILSCLSLELPWRDNEPNVSCVPEGEYEIKYEYSNKFKRFLWELKGVPDRSEVKIHPANNVNELEGCIALGIKLSLRSAFVSSRPSVTVSTHNGKHTVIKNNNNQMEVILLLVIMVVVGYCTKSMDLFISTGSRLKSQQVLKGKI